MVVVIIVVIVISVIGVIIAVASNQNTPPPSGQEPGSPQTCYSYCMGLVELQCGDNKFMGGCFGIWDCKAQTGAHQCR